MHRLPHNAALLLIDLRDGHGVPRGTARRNNPAMEENVRQLVQAWRTSGRPVLPVDHATRWPGAPLHYSAVVGTTLEGELARRGIGTLVLTGLATDRCVSTTARMAANLGFTTYVVADATATFERLGPGGRRHCADDVHAIALAELNGEFATIVDTASVLRTLMAEPTLDRGGPQYAQTTAAVEES
jgi:nicotinamidase-related amidase